MHYSGSQGYALGLDTSGELAVLVDTTPRTPVVPDHIVGGFWNEVIYEPAEQRRIAEELLRFSVDHLLPNMQSKALGFLATLTCLLKHPGFKDEREVRFLAVNPGDCIRTHCSTAQDHAASCPTSG